MSTKVLRIAGGVILTVAIVWALVFGWWQSTDYQPDRGELALYLLALPLALVGGYFLLRLSIDQLKAKPAGGAATQPVAADQDPLALARAKTAAAERAWSLPLVDSFVLTAGASSAKDLLAAVDAGKRPAPAPELRDSEGRPVIAAVVGELDAEAAGKELAERQPNLKKLLERDDALRALALLNQPLREASEAIQKLFADPPAQKFRLHLICLAPAAWDNSHFPALQSWLRAFEWPSGEALDLDVELVPVASDAEALRQVDQAIVQANRKAGDDRLLILVAGAMSATTRERITERETRGGLFSWERQDRPIPGEGAVAILFAPEAACARLGLSDCVTVSRVSQGVRDKSLHAGGRVRGVLIGELLADLLAVSGVAAQDVKAAALDADHRDAHLTEALEGLGAAFDHLDQRKDCPAIGTVTGYLAPLSGLFALAAACCRARADQAPALCLCNQHDQERAVLLACPAGFRSPSESPSTT